MRRVSKPLAATLAALLLAAGLAACGGGNSSSTSTSSTSTETGSQAKGNAEGASKQNGVKNGGEGKSVTEAGSSAGNSEGGGSSASDFVPKPHHDSGGGSAKYRVKGGDNSVQEFGDEADASELDDAAAVLHDFLDARAEGNWAAACGYMSKSVVESFEKLAAQAKQVEATDCAGILEELTNPAAKTAMKTEAEKADVGSLRIEGERAFVIYTGIDGTVMAMPMADEGGVWKVASLTGTPLS